LQGQRKPFQQQHQPDVAIINQCEQSAFADAHTLDQATLYQCWHGFGHGIYQFGRVQAGEWDGDVNHPLLVSSMNASVTQMKGLVLYCDIPCSLGMSLPLCQERKRMCSDSLFHSYIQYQKDDVDHWASLCPLIEGDTIVKGCWTEIWRLGLVAKRWRDQHGCVINLPCNATAYPAPKHCLSTSFTSASQLLCVESMSFHLFAAFDESVLHHLYGNLLMLVIANICTAKIRCGSH